MQLILIIYLIGIIFNSLVIFLIINQEKSFYNISETQRRKLKLDIIIIVFLSWAIYPIALYLKFREEDSSL